MSRHHHVTKTQVAVTTTAVVASALIVAALTASSVDLNKLINAKAGATVDVPAAIYSQSITIWTQGVTVDGHGSTLYGNVWVSANNVTFKNWTIIGSMPIIGHVTDNPSITIDQSQPWSTRSAAIAKKYATWEKAYTTPYTFGVRAKAVTGCVFENLNVSGFYVGVSASASDKAHAVITSCACHDNGYGIWGEDFIISNTAINNFLAGISLEGVTGAVVSANVCVGNGLQGFNVTQNSAKCILTGNTAQTNGYYTETMENPGSSAFNFFGVGASNVCENDVAESQMDLTGIDGNGFIVDTSSNPVTLDHCIAYQCITGIKFTGTSGCTVTYCSLLGNTKYGMCWTVEPQSVSKCLFSGNALAINAPNGNFDYDLFQSGQPTVAFYGKPGATGAHDVVETFTVSAPPMFSPSVFGYGAR